MSSSNIELWEDNVGGLYLREGGSLVAHRWDHGDEGMFGAEAAGYAATLGRDVHRFDGLPDADWQRWFDGLVEVPMEGWAWAANAPGVPLPNGPRMVADIDAAAGAEAEVRLTPGDTWVFGGDPGTAAARYLGLTEEEENS